LALERKRTFLATSASWNLGEDPACRPRLKRTKASERPLHPRGHRQAGRPKTLLPCRASVVSRQTGMVVHRATPCHTVELQRAPLVSAPRLASTIPIALLRLGRLAQTTSGETWRSPWRGLRPHGGSRRLLRRPSIGAPPAPPHEHATASVDRRDHEKAPDCTPATGDRHAGPADLRPSTQSPPRYVPRGPTRLHAHPRRRLQLLHDDA
jgi:hypothetical protein